MAERAKLIDPAQTDLDVSGFATKPATKPSPGAIETIREVSEQAGLVSREPKAPKKAPVRRGRWKTGRNVPFHAKVSQSCNDGFYAIAEDAPKWTMGYTLERALEALQREIKQNGKS